MLQLLHRLLQLLQRLQKLLQVLLQLFPVLLQQQLLQRDLQQLLLLPLLWLLLLLLLHAQPHRAPWPRREAPARADGCCWQPLAFLAAKWGTQ